MVWHDAARVFRRVLRRFGEKLAVWTVVEVDYLLLMAAQRADITHAKHSVPADVMLHLETETLNAGNVPFRISRDHSICAERDSSGGLANRGEVAEAECRIVKQR